VTKDIFSTPAARAAVSDPALTRPDWTVGVYRDREQLWADKNENCDSALATVIEDIIADLPRDALFAYPELTPLYNKLAAMDGLPADNLLLSAGSDGAIRSAFEAYVEPGDVVIHTNPTFAMYSVYSQMYGARPVTLDYQMENNGPVLRPDSIVTTIKSVSPKLVCLPNPDSPTGTVFEQEDMRAIVETAGQSGALMLVDEAYYPFYDKTILPWIHEYPHLMITRTFGKSWGAAGLRVGYAAASRDVTLMLHKVKPMYEIGALSALILEKLLDHRDSMLRSVAALNQGRDQFQQLVQDLGYATFPSHGNFFHAAFGADAEPIHAALKDLIYYRPHYASGCLAGYSRFTAATPERLKPIINEIKRINGENQ
jgi:histidinol-phosphate aminotransferase